MSEYKYLDENGLVYYHSKVKTLLGDKVDKVSGKGLSTNDYTTAEKNKLSGIATGAEVNQNAFSNVAVGETTIAADSKTDTLTIAAGDNVTLSANSTSDTLTISATDTTYSNATTSAAGLMSAEDKTKLNGIATGATKVTVDSTLSSTSTNPVQNKVINSALGNKVDKVSGKGLSTNDYTTAEKDKLAGIAEGATANVGTITGVSMNGTSIATSGVANITSLPASILTGTIKNGVTATTQTAGDSSTKVATTAFVGTAIANALADITGIDFQIVETLPSTGVKGTIYLVSNSGTGTNVYDEYIWVNNKWEKIGTTNVDLSGYVQKSEMVAITNSEIDTIVA